MVSDPYTPTECLGLMHAVYGQDAVHIELMQPQGFKGTCKMHDERSVEVTGPTADMVVLSLGVMAGVI